MMGNMKVPDMNGVFSIRIRDFFCFGRVTGEMPIIEGSPFPYLIQHFDFILLHTKRELVLDVTPFQGRILLHKLMDFDIAIPILEHYLS